MKMKKIVLALLFGFGIVGAQAQIGDLKSGLRFGIGETDFDERDGAEIGASSSRVSYQFGPSVQMDFTDWFGVQGGLLFSYRGAKLQGQDDPNGIFGSNETFDNKYTFMSLSVPVLPTLMMDLGKFSINIFAGPEVAFSIGSNYSKIYRDDAVNDDHGLEKQDLSNSTDAVNLGLTTGIGVNVDISANGTFFVDFRTNNYGKTKVGTVPDVNGDFKNANLATYYIGFGTRYTL